MGRNDDGVKCGVREEVRGEPLWGADGKQGVSGWSEAGFFAEVHPDSSRGVARGIVPLGGTTGGNPGGPEGAPVFFSPASFKKWQRKWARGERGGRSP